MPTFAGIVPQLHCLGQAHNVAGHRACQRIGGAGSKQEVLWPSHQPVVGLVMPSSWVGAGPGPRHAADVFCSTGQLAGRLVSAWPDQN